MFRNHLEDCLSFGKPLLIENIEEELDPVLDPVLERRYLRKGAPGWRRLVWHWNYWNWWRTFRRNGFSFRSRFYIWWWWGGQ